MGSNAQGHQNETHALICGDPITGTFPRKFASRAKNDV